MMSMAHAEIQFGNSKVMLAEESEDCGNFSPQTLHDLSVNLCLYVEDVRSVEFKRLLSRNVWISKSNVYIES